MLLLSLAIMLEGRRKVSLPPAVFLVENTYANGELNYAAFKANATQPARGRGAPL